MNDYKEFPGIFQDLLAHTRNGLLLPKKMSVSCIYIYTSIILKVSSIVCFHFVVIMSSCSQSTCNTILVVAATINSCAMSALIDDYKAK